MKQMSSGAALLLANTSNVEIIDGNSVLLAQCEKIISPQKRHPLNGLPPSNEATRHVTWGHPTRHMRPPETSHKATRHVTWGHPRRHFLTVSWCKPSSEKKLPCIWNSNKLHSIFLRWKPCSEGHIRILRLALLYKSQNITEQSERRLYSSSAVGCFLLLRYYCVPDETGFSFTSIRSYFFAIIHQKRDDDSRGLAGSVVGLFQTKDTIGKDLNDKSSVNTKKDKLQQHGWKKHQHLNANKL